MSVLCSDRHAQGGMQERKNTFKDIIINAFDTLKDTITRIHLRTPFILTNTFRILAVLYSFMVSLYGILKYILNMVSLNVFKCI